MRNYKLREGKEIRKPVVREDELTVYVPVLLICLALAALIWLYVTGLSKLVDDPLPSDPPAVSDTEGDCGSEEEPAESTPNIPASACLPFSCGNPSEL